MIGSAFACGGFSVAMLVYIFNKGEYHPLVRPALLASLFGYTLAGAAVIFDLGRWWNVWNIFWPWSANPNSVMFEVAVCITLYIVVMWIEFSPAFLEKFGMKDVKRKLNKMLFFFIALGVLLPMMHQSSLGTLLVVLGPQVHPLWQTPVLPLLFLLTAIIMGYARGAVRVLRGFVGLPAQHRDAAADAAGEDHARPARGLSWSCASATLLWRGALRHGVRPSRSKR